jgi:serine/threonine protein kinase
LLFLESKIEPIEKYQNAYLEGIEIGNKIGGGAFGDVYNGIWANNTVALKKLHKKSFESKQIEEFFGETQLLQVFLFLFIILILKLNRNLDIQILFYFMDYI